MSYMASQTSFPPAPQVGMPLSVALLVPPWHFLKNHIFCLFFSSSWHRPQGRLSQLWSLNKQTMLWMPLSLSLPFHLMGPSQNTRSTLRVCPLLTSRLPPTPPAPVTVRIVAIPQLGLPSTNPHVTAPNLTHRPPLPVKPRDAHLRLYTEIFGTPVWSTGQIVERDDFLNASKRDQP